MHPGHAGGKHSGAVGCIKDDQLEPLDRTALPPPAPQLKFGEIWERLEATCVFFLDACTGQVHTYMCIYAHITHRHWALSWGWSAARGKEPSLTQGLPKPGGLEGQNCTPRNHL